MKEERIIMVSGLFIMVMIARYNIEVTKLRRSIKVSMMKKSS